MKQLSDLMDHLQQTKNFPGRVLKADVIDAALREYAKKVGLET